MVVDIYGHLHPVGQYNVLKSWLNALSIEIPVMPEGEILTLIDNDQVLLKKWTVRKDNFAQIRISKSVCYAQFGTNEEVFQRNDKPGQK